MSRKIMEQALLAFEAIMFEKTAEACQIIAKNARYALREELAKPEQEPVTNSDLYSTAGRLALELECLLLDTKDISIVSKWWDSAHEALDQWRKFHLRACTELDSDEITKSCDSKPESDAMRLYQAVDRLATQAGEDAGKTIDWLCGEHGGMFKLFESYFSPKPLANQTVDSGSPSDSSTNIAGSSIDSSDSSTHSADSAKTFGKPDIGIADPCPQCQRGGVCRTMTCRRLQLPVDHPYRNQAYALAQPEHPLDKKADNARELGLDYEPEQEPVIGKRFDPMPPPVATVVDEYSKLLTAPPKQSWVGLTDDEILSLVAFETHPLMNRTSIVKVVEAKLREKNV